MYSVFVYASVFMFIVNLCICDCVLEESKDMRVKDINFMLVYSELNFILL